MSGNCFVRFFHKTRFEIIIRLEKTEKKKRVKDSANYIDKKRIIYVFFFSEKNKNKTVKSIANNRDDNAPNDFPSENSKGVFRIPDFYSKVTKKSHDF